MYTCSSVSSLKLWQNCVKLKQKMFKLLKEKISYQTFENILTKRCKDFMYIPMSILEKVNDIAKFYYRIFKNFVTKKMAKILKFECKNLSFF